MCSIEDVKNLLRSSLATSSLLFSIEVNTLAIGFLDREQERLQRVIDEQAALPEDLPVEPNPDPEWPAMRQSEQQAEFVADDDLDGRAAEFERWQGLTHNGRASENGGRWLERNNHSESDSSD
ncbi:hypothetical protein R1sor_012133 [Riccia sorocarpa]|uniref:Uncharacterized protein n=1 Tax=Riccia sorocarpa TaxID=122646 RepID=A0ABD3I2Y0_9MARC